MITDIFSRRYKDVVIRSQYFEEDRRFMNQAAVMVLDPLWMGQESDKPSDYTEQSLKPVHDALAMELGRESLSDRWWFSKRTWNGNTTTDSHAYSLSKICRNFLTKLPDNLEAADSHVKDRLSFIELAFQYRLRAIQRANLELPARITEAERADAAPHRGPGIRLPGRRADGVRASNARMNETFANLVDELNQRIKLANYPLSFHNGMLQLALDDTVTAQVAKPFWALVSTPIWKNVDEQIKEAIDRRDRADRTAAFHAVCALESAIKIISDTKGWTTSKEKGASNYIDNLVSEKNGRFIDVWESEMLKSMFGDVRNPFAHGPGQGPMPKLSDDQTDWAIDTSMSWIKSLIRRM
ncbi:MAG: hypothetical protein VR74_14470 [Hyphomonas sp. BRH_c22]|uniref:AbiJ-NTD4 domain-containing protein n=1 Tax=Hyphomonas sp. BRH_c22 TaxID=1629710 RepID=UPI0005F2313A|nr:hypothetical protein [Hyphomonas sp. BRH_c22]KJS36016.1 MAG: hypothetical protein VR74_14470 [Hyphomonas sp. BRH_c22]